MATTFPNLSDNGGKQSNALKLGIKVCREAGPWAQVVWFAAGVVGILARHIGEAMRDVLKLAEDIDRTTGGTSGNDKPAGSPAPEA